MPEQPKHELIAVAAGSVWFVSPLPLVLSVIAVAAGSPLVSCRSGHVGRVGLQVALVARPCPALTGRADGLASLPAQVDGLRILRPIPIRAGTLNNDAPVVEPHPVIPVAAFLALAPTVVAVAPTVVAIADVAVAAAVVCRLLHRTRSAAMASAVGDYFSVNFTPVIWPVLDQLVLESNTIGTFGANPFTIPI